MFLGTIVITSRGCTTRHYSDHPFRGFLTSSSEQPCTGEVIAIQYITALTRPALYWRSALLWVRVFCPRIFPQKRCAVLSVRLPFPFFRYRNLSFALPTYVFSLFLFSSRFGQPFFKTRMYPTITYY